MGLFDMFKKDKKEKSYDPLNMKVTDLDKGFIFDYDLKTWVVEEVYGYDWGNNYTSKEYKVNSGDEEYFLSVDDDDEVFITLSKKIKIRAIQEDLPEVILEKEAPPKKLVYKDTKFYSDGEEIGEFRWLNGYEENDPAKFISWEYFDEDDKLTLCIEQWGEEEFEASYGKVLKEFEISNIIPSEQ